MNTCNIQAYPFNEINYKNFAYSFSYIPLYFSKVFIEEFGLEITSGIQTFEDIIICMNKLIPAIIGVGCNLSMEGITEITEEEFYKID